MRAAEPNGGWRARDALALRFAKAAPDTGKMWVRPQRKEGRPVRA